MISPNMWTFDPPKCEISYAQGKLIDLEPKIRTSIKAHYFNNQIVIALPDTHKTPDRLQNIISNTDHYILKNIPLVEFIDRHFIEGFIKRGSFYCLSIDTRIDIDTTIALTPCGKLFLVVDRDLYQSLGLEGKVSKFARKSKNRYILEINLQDPHFVHGATYYKQVHRALSNDAFSKMSYRFYWEPIDDSICTSSLAKYFFDRGYTVDVCPTEITTHQEYDLTIPELEQDNKTDEVFASPHEIVEYFGMLALSCHLDEPSYLSSYCVTGKTMKIGTTKIVRWKGLFTCTTIEKLFNQLKHIASNRPEIPWIALYCHGFPHTPVKWNTLEHNFGVNGNNSYTIFITPSLNGLWYQFSESNKVCS